jgi:DNA-binding IclR family transcriptional regulator
MTAYKIAEYTGTPRPTVIRRLDALVAMGAIERRGKRCYVTPERLDIIARNVRANARAVIHAGVILSKLDTETLAPRAPAFDTTRAVVTAR